MADGGIAQRTPRGESVLTCSLLQSLHNPRVIALAVIYFGIAAASVGLVMFLIPLSV
jgi:hypothetical protein